MSIDIAEKQEGSFDDVFRTTKTNLPPIKANVTKKKGAKIPGVTLQYAYVLYKVNGPASTLSMLSNVVTEELDNVKGYKVDDWAEYLINLKMPVEALNKYVRVYRVAYSKAGQLPRVDVIYDQKCAT